MEFIIIKQSYYKALKLNRRTIHRKTLYKISTNWYQPHESQRFSTQEWLLMRPRLYHSSLSHITYYLSICFPFDNSEHIFQLNSIFRFLCLFNGNNHWHKHFYRKIHNCRMKGLPECHTEQIFKGHSWAHYNVKKHHTQKIPYIFIKYSIILP